MVCHCRSRPALEPLSPFHAEIRKKQHITLTSLRKVEDGTLLALLIAAAYTIRVRSAEYAHDPAVIQDLVRRALTSGSSAADEDTM